MILLVINGLTDHTDKRKDKPTGSYWVCRHPSLVLVALGNRYVGPWRDLRGEGLTPSYRLSRLLPIGPATSRLLPAAVEAGQRVINAVIIKLL